MGSDRTWLAVALVAFALGAALRLSGTGDRFLAGDELHTLPLVRAPYTTIVASLDPRIGAGGVALPLLQRAAADVVGPSVWAFRLPALAGGLAALLLVFPVARRLLDAPTAAVATFALATSPVHVFYSQFARSYALASALVLLLCLALLRATDDAHRTRVDAALAAACLALIPWVHLTALSTAACALLGAALRAFAARRRPADLAPLAAVTLAGLAGAALLYLPAWEGLTNVLAVLGTKRADVPPSLAVEVATRFAGSRPGGWLWLVSLPLGALWLSRVRPRAAMLLVPVALFPVLYLALRTATPGVYSNARYLITTLPFQGMILSFAIVAGVRALLRTSPRRDLVAAAIGVGVFGAAFALGPLGPRHVDDGAFASGYHSMHRMPDAMNRPFPNTPGFYRTLAAEAPTVRVVEAPHVAGRHLGLYRNYYLQHRKRTALGAFRPGLPEGWPYVDLRRGRSAVAEVADYLIVHLDVDAELRRSLGADRGGVANPLVFAVGEPLPRSRAVLVGRLSARLGLGEPVHQSADLAVWKVR